MSMMLVWYPSDIIEYDIRTSALSNAPLHMKQDTTSIEKKTDRSTSTSTYPEVVRIESSSSSALSYAAVSIFLKVRIAGLAVWEGLPTSYSDRISYSFHRQTGLI